MRAELRGWRSDGLAGDPVSSVASYFLSLLGMIYRRLIEECRWFAPLQCRPGAFPLRPKIRATSPHSLLRRLWLLHLLQPFLHQHDLLFLGELGEKELNLEPHAPRRST